MPAMTMDPTLLGDLQRVLRVLASPNRLHLLVALQEPKRVSDIALAPERDSAWGGGERRISRQAVKEHLDALAEIGVVTTVPDEAETRYVVNHARLFEATEQLRELARVKPRVDLDLDTLSRDVAARGTKPSGPHLVLVRGVREGQVWRLGSAPEGGWLIGRSKDAEVSLDYDPYVSHAHARILARDGRHFLVDLPSNTNGTFVNSEPLARGAPAPLEAGDLVATGMSLLLYRR